MLLEPITLPAFGAAIPGQGGHFTAIMRGPVVDGIEQPPYALLASDAALGEVADVPWGEYGKDVHGTSSRTDGLANTIAMAAANCPAALRVQAITIDGHNDYYLPALGELNSAGANAPELFSTDDYYWTSTQGSRGYAFVQDFEDGTSYWYDKDGERRVRAVRRIPLQLLTA